MLVSVPHKAQNLVALHLLGHIGASTVELRHDSADRKQVTNQLLGTSNRDTSSAGEAKIEPANLLVIVNTRVPIGREL